MIKNKISLLVTALMFMFGCNNSSTDDNSKVNLGETRQVLKTCLMSDLTSLDPRIGVDSLSDGVLRMLFHGLTFMDEENNTKLALAESYSISPDLKTYTFFLKDLKWSDGTPLRAQDFENTWKEMLQPEFNAPNVNLLYLIKNARAAKKESAPMENVGVKSLDERTLQIELETPNPAFLDALTNCAFYPMSDKMRKSPTDHTTYVCTGPFKLKKYSFQDKIIIEKNPHYWDADNVRLSEIEFYIIKEESTALMMFEKGEIDWLGSPLANVSLEALPDLMKKGSLKIVPVAGTTWLEFNTLKFPFTNKKIRKALAFAINREEIIENILHNSNSIAFSLLSPTQKKDRWHPYFKDNDTEFAKVLFSEGLAELGITVEQFPVITISYNTTEVWRKVMLAIQQQWQETFGIQVRIEGTDPATYFKKLWQKDFEIARFGWRVQYNDPANMLEVFKYKDFVNNHTGWESPEYVSNLNKSLESSKDDRWEFLEKAEEKLIQEDMTIMPFCHISSVTLQKPYLKNVFVTPLYTVDFRSAYIEKH